MTSECVKLREGVQIVPAPDGSDFPAFLVDGLLEQRLKLDDTVFAVVEHSSFTQRVTQKLALRL